MSAIYEILRERSKVMDIKPETRMSTSGSNGGPSPTSAGTIDTAQDPNQLALLSKIPKILPHERVFPIQIGTELFKLSGASLSFDAPSYFSRYFECQIAEANERGEDLSMAIRTLYIDRDPSTFRDISLHLQGYHIQPRDGTHFVRLFADAQFYSLPRLISQLYAESIFISIGHREFQIPRDLFEDTGNSPNFFTLGYSNFFSSPDKIFPGLDREGLIRPPSIQPPSVTTRSADNFAEILHMLRGYPISIRNEAHRASLVRDCRYFNFKGLEQRLVPHLIFFNQARSREEITIRLEDTRKSGLSVAPEPTRSDTAAAWVNYRRPFVDDRAHELILEIDGERTRLHFFPTQTSLGSIPVGTSSGYTVRAEFFRDARTRIGNLFDVISTKLNLPRQHGLANGSGLTPGLTPISDDLIRVALDPEASITLDGQPWIPSPSGFDSISEDLGPALEMGGARKRRRVDAGGAESWIVKTGQWRLRIRSSSSGKAPVECVLVAVKIEALSGEQMRNAQRPFLSGSDGGGAPALVK